GRQLGVLHTPDFFILRTDGALWLECKTEEDLLRLQERQPHRYRRDPSGLWRCPPGEEYATEFGFSYLLRSSAEIDWTFQRNVHFLEDYLRAERLEACPETVTYFQSLAAAQPGIGLATLLSLARQYDLAVDLLYILIVTDKLYVDLSAAALAEPERVRVFHSLARAEEFTQTHAHASKSPAQAAGDPRSPAEELLTAASPAALAVANQRYAMLFPAPHSDGHHSTVSVPERTRRRWRASFRQAEAEAGIGFLGLLPGQRRQGNRLRKLPAETVALMEQMIIDEYEKWEQPTRFAVWSKLLRACQERALLAPSYQTFCLAVKRRPLHQQTLKRRGARAAYKAQEFYHELELRTPRHGDRPFEIAHIDHTELDMELVSSGTRRNLGRPWATFLTDAFSRRVLAAVLSFDPPSYQSCMLALRECVARFARLPQTIVMDGGREFGSVYFETLLARFEITKKTRPAAEARFGSVVERLFGTTNTRFIYNLIGNTQMTKGEVREVTAAVDPKNLATWTFAALLERLQQFTYEVYDQLDHPALGESPREAFAAELLQSGARKHRVIAETEEFRILTLPSTRKGTAQVVPGRGVLINYLFYWTDGFRDAGVERTQVPVRFDPVDAGLAYAYVCGQWRQCTSEYHTVFKGRSVREVMLGSVELRRRRQQHQRNVAITACRLAEFLNSVQADEAVALQRLRDAETKKATRRKGNHSSGATKPQVTTLQEPQASSETFRLPEYTARPDQLEVYEEYQ
ncbi:MAG: DDE-type integrase/transposase/recombinase, partial [Acidobacteria bacterium]|nr:DDE-type integrase/transposase/recombinase [Acidobacteriota bacterium]